MLAAPDGMTVTELALTVPDTITSLFNHGMLLLFCSRIARPGTTRVRGLILANRIRLAVQNFLILRNFTHSIRHRIGRGLRAGERGQSAFQLPLEPYRRDGKGFPLQGFLASRRNRRPISRSCSTATQPRIGWPRWSTGLTVGNEYVAKLDGAALFAWLHRDALIAALDAEIDRHGAGVEGEQLTAKDRAARLAGILMLSPDSPSPDRVND